MVSIISCGEKRWGGRGWHFASSKIETYVVADNFPESIAFCRNQSEIYSMYSIQLRLFYMFCFSPAGSFHTDNSEDRGPQYIAQQQVASAEPPFLSPPLGCGGPSSTETRGQQTLFPARRLSISSSPCWGSDGPPIHEADIRSLVASSYHSLSRHSFICLAAYLYQTL